MRWPLPFTTCRCSYNVSILYGTRRFGSAEHEVLLVDANRAYIGPVNDLKGWLYQWHGMHIGRYESEPEFVPTLHAAPASIAALLALVGAAEQPAFFLAHEWLGLPALFAAQQQRPGQFRTIFYAHETATVRAIVEGHEGHDLRFYNAMRLANQYGLSMEQVFGDYSDFFKHALLRGSMGLEGIFAVGDLVKEELLFMEPSARGRTLDIVYNGVPSTRLTSDEKWHSKALLQRYALNLHGFIPSWVFTHVTRLVPSKGIWRDLRVLERLDEFLAQRGETAIYYLLSSVRPAGRRSEDVFRWEQEYGWPLQHRADNGDLIAYEWEYYQMIEAFNRTARATRAVFINQFGWSRDRCGERMPAEMEFKDLRYGADVEFGQSIYEPFGIAQVEPLSFGALCVVSTACGCIGFIRDAGGMDLPNVVVGDYLFLPDWVGHGGLDGALSIGRGARDAVEGMVADQVARRIIERLPRTAESAATLLEEGYQLSTRMSWEVVVRDYFLPPLDRITGGQTLQPAIPLPVEEAPPAPAASPAEPEAVAAPAKADDAPSEALAPTGATADDASDTEIAPETTADDFLSEAAAPEATSDDAPETEDDTDDPSDADARERAPTDSPLRS